MENIIKNKLSKPILAGMAGLLFLFAACSSNHEDSFKGTFVSRAEGEMSISNDTLMLLADQQRGHLWTIERRTGYQLIGEDGTPGQLQQETEHWQGIYDPDSRVIRETRKGKLISLEGDTLRVGKRKYKRIE